MKLKKILEILDADVLLAHDNQLDIEIKTAAAGDLMSDILAMIKVPDILLTGLSNLQVINTASVFGIKIVIFVRGKLIDSKVLELADNEGISLISTKFSMYESCGMLYEKGLRSVHIRENKC